MKVGLPQEVNNRGAHLNSVSTVDNQFDLRGLVGCVIACSTIWGGLRLTVPHFYRPLKQVVGQRREQEAGHVLGTAVTYVIRKAAHRRASLHANRGQPRSRSRVPIHSEGNEACGGRGPKNTRAELHL